LTRDTIQMYKTYRTVGKKKLQRLAGRVVGVLPTVSRTMTI